MVVLDSGINTVTRRRDETSWGEAEVAEIRIYGHGIHDDSFDNRDKMTVLETLIEQETLRRGAVEAPKFKSMGPGPVLSASLIAVLVLSPMKVLDGTPLFNTWSEKLTS